MTTPAQPQRAKRRARLVDAGFQLSLAIQVALVVLGAMTTVTASIHAFLEQYEAHARRLGLTDDDLTLVLLQDQRSSLDVILALTTVSAMAVCIGLTLLVSHRAAGPVYRLCMELNRVARGEPRRRVEFRKSDHFGGLADAYNRSLEAESAQRRPPS